jgi:hypothetical protein
VFDLATNGIREHSPLLRAGFRREIHDDRSLGRRKNARTQGIDESESLE